jgi:hypothetical protein
LAIWTLLILSLIPVVRIRAARSGRVRAKDFRYSESPLVPGNVSLPNRAYMNLLELPVLFYVACLAVLATKRYDVWILSLAWAFVASRIAHSLIHLLYNDVLHRLVAFGIGVVLTAAIWLRLLLLALGDPEASP